MAGSLRPAQQDVLNGPAVKGNENSGSMAQVLPERPKLNGAASKKSFRAAGSLLSGKQEHCKQGLS